MVALRWRGRYGKAGSRGNRGRGYFLDESLRHTPRRPGFSSERTAIFRCGVILTVTRRATLFCGGLRLPNGFSDEARTAHSAVYSGERTEIVRFPATTTVTAGPTSASGGRRMASITSFAIRVDSSAWFGAARGMFLFLVRRYLSG